jgi:hypothetical protein
MIVRLIAASAVLVALGACQATAPGDASNQLRRAVLSPPTLLVTNATCNPGPCVPFEVRAFIPQWRVPGQPPAGVPFMGSVTSRVVCLRFPVADTFRTIAVNSVGTPIDTALTVWTADSAVVLFAATSPMSGLGETTEFVPASSAGWSVTLPGAAAQVPPAPGPACTP